MGRAVRAQGPVTFETVHVARSGRELPVEVTLNCLEWGGREFFCAFARDITERKRSEKALRESEERYRSLFDGVPIGLYRSTPSGQLLEVNLSLLRILGAPNREALLRTNAADFYLDPEDRHGWQQALSEGKAARAFEAQLRRHDGRIIWARFSLQAFRDEEQHHPLRGGARGRHRPQAGRGGPAGERGALPRPGAERLGHHRDPGGERLDPL